MSNQASAFSVSQEEREAGTFAADKVAAIAAAITDRGYAVVEHLVSPESCAMLLASVLEDAERVRSVEGPTRHEAATGAGHLQLGLRRNAPYVRADLVANPLIEHVVTAVLGEEAWLGFYNGNVNLPGSVHQPLHFDRPYSWRTPEAAAQAGHSWPPPTTTLSCSVALTTIAEENGATEIYPGSHKETAVASWPLGERLSAHPELLERWGPPARMPIPAGGICFRDPRMWHRGVPNPSTAVRPMIALTYHAGRCHHWRGRLISKLGDEDRARCEADPTLKVLDNRELGDGRLVFEDGVRDVFESSANPHRVNRNVRFVEAPMRVNHFLDAHELGGARVVESDTIGPEE